MAENGVLDFGALCIGSGFGGFFSRQNLILSSSTRVLEMVNVSEASQVR